MGKPERACTPHMLGHWGLRTYVETGTGRGRALGWAAAAVEDGKLLFDQLYSCDVNPARVEAALRLHRNDGRISAVVQEATAFLEGLRPKLAGIPTLFWLDAKFPKRAGSDRRWDAEKVVDVRCPLLRSLRILVKRASAGERDVIICDDLRVYMDEKFQSGLWPARKLYVHYDIEDIIASVRDYFVPMLSYHDQGYLTLLPR